MRSFTKRQSLHLQILANSSLNWVCVHNHTHTFFIDFCCFYSEQMIFSFSPLNDIIQSPITKYFAFYNFIYNLKSLATVKLISGFSILEGAFGPSQYRQNLTYTHTNTVWQNARRSLNSTMHYYDKWSKTRLTISLKSENLLVILTIILRKPYEKY